MQVLPRATLQGVVSYLGARVEDGRCRRWWWWWCEVCGSAMTEDRNAAGLVRGLQGAFASLSQLSAKCEMKDTADGFVFVTLAKVELEECLIKQASKPASSRLRPRHYTELANRDLQNATSNVSVCAPETCTRPGEKPLSTCPTSMCPSGPMDQSGQY